jgi:hypothetical protein
MQTNEKAQVDRSPKRDWDRYETGRTFHLGKNEWHKTTLIYPDKGGSEHDDHCQYSVFVS